MSRFGLSLGRRGAGDQNPLFGQSTYDLLKARITRSFSWRAVPSEVGRQIGRLEQAILTMPENARLLRAFDTWLNVDRPSASVDRQFGTAEA